MAPKIFFVMIAIVVAFSSHAMSEEVAVKYENDLKIDDAGKTEWFIAGKGVNAGESRDNQKKEVQVITVKTGRDMADRVLSRCHDPVVDCARDVFDDCPNADGCFCVIPDDLPDYCGMYRTPPNTP